MLSKNAGIQRGTLPYMIAGIVSIPVMIICIAVFIMFSASVFSRIAAFRSGNYSAVQSMEPSVVFTVDDFFNLINEGKYSVATSRYAYQSNSVITSVSSKMASIFPKGSIDRAEPYDLRMQGNRAVIRLKVFLKDGTVKEYKEDLSMYKEQTGSIWKIDCSYIDDPGYWK